MKCEEALTKTPTFDCKVKKYNAFHYFVIAPEPPNVASATSLDHVTYEKRKNRNCFLNVFLENV